MATDSGNTDWWLDSLTSDAYEALAFNLLTANHLAFFEKHIAAFSRRINIVSLASVITSAYTSGRATTTDCDDLLWLLAHFIDLHKTRPSASGPSVLLRALYVQLSTLQPQITTRLPLLEHDPGDDQEKKDALPQPLSPYVAAQITSLVDRAGIGALLTDITSFVTSTMHDLCQSFIELTCLKKFCFKDEYR